MSASLSWPKGVFWVLFIVVTFLTLTPNPPETEPGFALTRWIASVLFHDVALADKVAHFMAYGSLGAAARWAQLTLFSKRWSIVLGLAAYGVLLEGLQGLGGVRTPELADAVANGAGALAGYAGAHLLGVVLQLRAR